MAQEQPDEFKFEITEIRREFDFLKQRLMGLEQRLDSVEKNRASRADAQSSEQTYIVASSSVPAAIEAREKANTPVQDSLELDPARPPQQGLEARIGTLWLNRVGLGVLLVGLVSLLLYSFQFFVPAARIVVGFMVASLVIYISHRPIDAIKQQKTFLAGLSALGWSLAYFVAYGMYFIEPLKITDSLLLEMIALSVMAGCAMVDAVAYNSEATALLSSSFAFGTLFLGGASVGSSVISLAFFVIALSATAVSIRKEWHRALFTCCVLFFVSLSLYNLPPDFLLDFVLIAGWLLFNSASLVVKEIPKKQGWAVIGTSLVSAIFFTYLLKNQLSFQLVSFGSDNVSASVYGVIGFVYLITAGAFKRRGLNQLWNLHLLIGLFLLNSSIWLKLTGEAGFAADVCEIALLTAIGFKFEIRMFRYFAIFCSLVALCSVPDSIPWISFALASAALCSYLYELPENRGNQHWLELKTGGPWFYLLTNGCCLRLMAHSHLPTEFKPFATLIQAIVNTVLSLKFQSWTSRIIAGMLLIGSSCAALANGLSILQSVLAALVSLSTYLYCRTTYEKKRDTFSKFWKLTYAILANSIILWSINAHVQTNLISAFWGLDGFALMVLGFVLREKTFRIFALLVFSVVTVRLLFFDLASAPTMYRIVSFILAGAFFVGSSYAYNWFGKRIFSSEATAVANPESAD